MGSHQFHTCTHIYSLICSWSEIDSKWRVHLHTHTYVLIHSLKQVYSDQHGYTHIYSPKYAHSYVSTHSYTHVCSIIYAHTHSHIQLPTQIWFKHADTHNPLCIFTYQVTDAYQHIKYKIWLPLAHIHMYVQTYN